MIISTLLISVKAKEELREIEIFFAGRSLIYGTSIRNQFDFHCKTIFGGQGRTHGEMTDPSGLFVDSGGNVISADSKNDRIQVEKKLAWLADSLVLFVDLLIGR